MYELLSREPETFNKSLGFFDSHNLCILVALSKHLKIFGIKYWYMQDSVMRYTIDVLEAEDIDKIEDNENN